MENKNNYKTWVCIDGPKNILGRESRVMVRAAQLGVDLGLFEAQEAQLKGYNPDELKIFMIYPEGESWHRQSSPRVAKHLREDLVILVSPFGGEDYIFKRKR